MISEVICAKTHTHTPTLKFITLSSLLKGVSKPTRALLTNSSAVIDVGDTLIHHEERKRTEVNLAQRTTEATE